MSNDPRASTTPIQSYSPRLYNADLAPVEKRTWGVYNFFALWMQDIHSITVYTFAAALFFMGLNGWQVFAALTISVLIIWALMTLVGIAGQRTGVPFPVLARSAFGINGANVAALIRAGVAVIYYGVLTYLGSVSLQLAALSLVPGLQAWTRPSFLGLHALGWACFAVMWLISRNQSQPFLDGPARWPFGILFFSDFPVSAIGFSMMWDGKWNSGLLLWGVIGTVWWYFLPAGIRRLRRRQILPPTSAQTRDGQRPK